MADGITIRLNGAAMTVQPGTTVAAAIAAAGSPSRYSTSGQPRAPLCGMGICFECRARVNGTAHVKTCQLRCSEGMEIETDV